jgi:O-antigen/teichoic acid export membrane protein
VKGVSFLAMLVTVPLVLRALGEERYGLLITITSSLSMLGLADLGIGNGLISLLANARGRGDIQRVRGLVSSGWYITWLSALVVLACFALTSPLLRWPALLNARGAVAMAEAPPAVALALTMLAVGMPLGIVQRVYSAYQEGFLGNAWLAAGSILTILLTWLAARTGAGLPFFVLAALGGGLLVQALASAFEFGWRRPEIRPSLSSTSVRQCKDLLSHGLLFFIIQIVVIAASASDGIIITHVLGPEAVARYSVASRLFVLAPTLLTTFLGPLWPAYADAITRSDTAWIKKALRRSLVVAVGLATGLGVPAVAAGPWLLKLWVGSISVPTSLVLGMAMCGLVMCVAGAFAMYLNGLQFIRLQAVMSGVTGVAMISAKTWAASRWGLWAIPWAQVLAYLAFTLIPSVIVVRGSLKRL